MSADPYLADIMLWPAPFEPAGWMFCDGRLLPINSNQALFSLLGTNYGGDGVTTFALPDLRGRVPMGVPGNGSDCCTPPGERAGAETFTAFPFSAAAPADEALMISAFLVADAAAPRDIRQPFVALNYVIAVEGIYPSRW